MEYRSQKKESRLYIRVREDKMSEKQHGAWLPIFESETKGCDEGLIGCDAVRGV